MSEYLDKTGLERFWTKVKAYVAENAGTTPSNITGNAGTATKLQTARAIDGVTFDGSTERNHFGTCSTSAATTTKTVSITGFTLVTGAKISVLFTYGISCSSAALNVSGTGGKPIYYKGSTLKANCVEANTVLELVYSGSYWRIIGDLALEAYPIGAIYLSVNSTNPGTLFGGTWVQWGAGKVPVGIDTSQTEFSTVEKSGGEKTHQLSADELPSHTHSIGGHTHTLGNHSHTIAGGATTAASSGAHTHVLKASNVFGSGTARSGVYNNGGNTASTAMDSAGAHTHSVPAHSHTCSANNGNTGANSAYNSGSVGSGSSHNNLQPYITCYMWKRTA